jgi:hypothetical protein
MVLMGSTVLDIIRKTEKVINMKNKILILIIICVSTMSIFAGPAVDCGTLKTLELQQGSDGRQYVVFSTSTPPPYFTGTYTQVGQLSGGGTLYALPEDPSIAALVYASFERALHNQNIHFFYLSASPVDQYKTIVDPSCPQGSPALVTRYFFKNMQ